MLEVEAIRCDAGSETYGIPVSGSENRGAGRIAYTAERASITTVIGITRIIYVVGDASVYNSIVSTG